MQFVKRNFRAIFVRPPGNDAAVDGLRALAILLVLTFHSFFFTQYIFEEEEAYRSFVAGFPLLFNWVWQGDKGVDIFFVISGFLIAKILLNDIGRDGRIELGNFFTRRLLRIVPLYLFAIVLYGFGGGNVEYFWANLLFINNLLPVENIFIPWSWSLSVEMQFYLLCPLLIILFNRWVKRPLWLLIFLIVAVALLRMVLFLLNPDLYNHSMLEIYLNGDKELARQYLESTYIDLHSRAAPLLIGVLVAYLITGYRDSLRSHLSRHPIASNGIAVVLVAAVVVVFLHKTHVPSSLPEWSATVNLLYLAFARLVLALGVGGLLLLALLKIPAGRWPDRILSNRLWFPVSQVSYAIYLFHVPFIFLAYYLVKGAEKIGEFSIAEVWLVALMALCFSFLFGMMTFIFLERPAQRLYRSRSATIATTQTSNATDHRIEAKDLG